MMCPIELTKLREDLGDGIPSQKKLEQLRYHKNTYIDQKPHCQTLSTISKLAGHL
jgi:hypothetical protein